MLKYEDLLAVLDSRVEGLKIRQVQESGRPDCGGFVNPEDGTAGLGGVALLGYAYLLEESRYFLNDELRQRILLAAEYGRRTRRPSSISACSIWTRATASSRWMMAGRNRPATPCRS